LAALYPYFGVALVIGVLALAAAFLARRGLILRKFKHNGTALEFDPVSSSRLNVDMSSAASTVITRNIIHVSEFAIRDCRVLSTSQELAVDFVLQEATRHPILFRAQFSSVPLVFGENVLLLSWNGSVATIERILDRTSAYPLNDLWTECLSAYRRAGLLSYRTKDVGILATPTERKRSIATYRRLVSKIKEFVQALADQGEYPPGVHQDLGPLLDEAEVALASDNIGVAVSRMEVLLSTAHKFITNNAPTSSASKAPQRAITTGQQPSRADTGKPKLLLVDDDPMALHRLLHFFRREDRFDVFAANTTAEALRLLVEHEFDIVITDLIMRATDSRLQMDGREVALAAKKSSSKTKVIVLTAYITMSINGELGAAGADALIDKASELAEVLQRTMEMLSSPPEQPAPNAGS
jgi:CheY-like chemotaxis protein